MKYKKIILLVLCAVFMLIPSKANAQNDKDSVDITPVLTDALDKLDLSAWQDIVKGNKYFNAYSGGNDPKKFITDLINGKSTLSLEKLANIILDDIISDTRIHIGYASVIAGLALISILLEKLSNGLFSGRISSLTLKLMFIVALAVIINGFVMSLNDCINGIKQMTELINSTFPIFTVLVSATGSITSSQILQPSVMLIASAMSNAVCSIILPLLTVSAVMTFCHCISEQGSFYLLSDNSKRLADKAIGIIFTVFLGIVSIQRLTSSALDTVSLRTIRYTLSSFSMYGGAFLSKSFDIVTGCAVMLKNIIGGVGMVILLTLCLTPAIKLLCASVVYGAISFLISFTGEARISECMRAMGRIYGTMFLCTITTAMLFFVIISVVASVGNSVIGA